MGESKPHRDVLLIVGAFSNDQYLGPFVALSYLVEVPEAERTFQGATNLDLA